VIDDEVVRPEMCAHRLVRREGARRTTDYQNPRATSSASVPLLVEAGIAAWRAAAVAMGAGSSLAGMDGPQRSARESAWRATAGGRRPTGGQA
jgi:hypothetical protein